jgi:beta-lactamase class D OXA-48
VVNRSESVLLSRPIFIALCLIVLIAPAHAGPILEREDWMHFFRDADTDGTFVLYDLKRDVYQACNISRAEQRFSPASTFEIPGSLIALQTGVVKSDRQVFRWDGVQRANEDWNSDHDLRSAFRFSVVPVYQQIARQTGAARMHQYVRLFAYGNEDTSGGIDRFWLDGSLKISALEQVRFLRRLYKNQLQVKARTSRTIRSIMTTESDSGYIVRAKTAWADGNPQIGWWVGWIEHGGDAYFFALNLDISTPEQHAQEREQIGRRILMDEGILPVKAEQSVSEPK